MKKEKLLMFDSLAERMKDYENVSRNYLVKKLPVIIRIDGKAFHTFTKQFKKPFDSNLMNLMNRTTIALCENIQNSKCAYVQSDEINILVSDLKDYNTSSWFDNNINKINSISASIATAYFNMYFYQYDNEALNKSSLAMFDARCFNLPEDEVENYFIYRQQDWFRNSLEMYCRAFFSHKQMNKKNQSMMHEMLYSIGKNWTTDLSDAEKNGRFISYDSCINEKYKWEVMKECPNFISEKTRNLIRKIIKG
jgi:tRNA(His) guanylyltransferase